MKSLRGAINAFCRSCLYDPVSGVGNWRQQVSACTSRSCPLYAVRPQSKPETRADREAIRVRAEAERAAG